MEVCYLSVQCIANCDAHIMHLTTQLYKSYIFQIFSSMQRSSPMVKVKVPWEHLYQFWNKIGKENTLLKK